MGRYDSVTVIKNPKGFKRAVREDKNVSVFLPTLNNIFTAKKCVIGLIFASVKNIGQASFLCYTPFCSQVEKGSLWESKLLKLFGLLKDSLFFS